ncbi:uncharacterized protein LOC133468162 [Phyllopteryx taeniolatus]|uniref:uncharacterized protein LOC133468162 n=1 Tax=Phyllopteryx taeniolatus TaxID=161469 RepID=UPI002AD4FF00|nr:uncharacterized protein LOC133468162 [Phyllopteryx taeniolatus]
MTTRELILIFLLQFEAISGQHTYVYARAGDVAVLPCKRSSCSGLSWLYSWDEKPLVREVENGRVLTSSARSQRLSVKDCSLLIDRVKAQDTGYFACQQSGGSTLTVLLTVMTLMSSIPWDSDPMQDGHVLLKCSLACYPGMKCSCGSGKLRWMDEEGQELSPQGTQQNNCLSSFKVLPAGRNRNYTCQYVAEDGVKVQAHYTAVSKEVNTKGPRDSPPGPNLLIIIIGAAVAVLMLIVVIVSIVLVKITSRRNSARDFSKHEDDNVTYASVGYNHKNEHAKQKEASLDETESDVTYTTLNLKKKNEDKAKKQVHEEEEEVVTYAAVRAVARSPPDQDVNQ